MFDVLAALVAVGVLLVVFTKFSEHPSDPLAFFCYGFAYFYLFRNVVVALDIASLHPEYLFEGASEALVARASIALIAFLIFFMIGFAVHDHHPFARRLVGFVPVTWTRPRLDRQMKLSIVLTILSSLLTFVLLSRYGGISQMLFAAKGQKDLAGLYVLRSIPSIAALLSVALFLALRQKDQPWNHHGYRLWALSAALLNAFYVFLWGTRTVAALVLVVLLTGRLLFHPEREGQVGDRLAIRRRYIEIAGVAIMMIAAVVGLRLLRDQLFIGRISPAIAGQSRVQQVSIASNSVYFDANVLALRDWPGPHPYRGGTDFTNGIIGMIPRSLWREKPTQILSGTWFRQLYEPTKVNGWPLGSVGDWYLNFGYGGIATGGVVSGVLFSVLMGAWRGSKKTPLGYAAMVAVVLMTMPIGYRAETPLRWASWLLPLWLTVRFVTPRRHRSGSAMQNAGAAVAR